MDKAEMLTWANARGISVALLDMVVTLGDDDVLCAAAQNPTLPSGTRTQLSHHDSPRVRAAAVRSGLLPASRVEVLASDSDVRVRVEVAGNAQVEPSTLDRLADDDAPAVRAAAVDNVRLSLETLSVKLNDPDETVRGAATDAAARRGVNVKPDDDIVRHGTAELTNVMLVDDDDFARLGSLRHDPLDDPAARAEALGDEDFRVREAFAGRPDLDVAEQQTLAGDPHPLVRQSLAGSRNLDEAVSMALSDDSDVLVRADLASATPHDRVQRKLATDDDAQVRAVLASRRGLPDDIVTSLAGDTQRAVRHRAVVNNPTVIERLDGVPVPDLKDWNVASWPARLAVLCGDPDTETAAQELAKTFPGSLGSLAKMARVMRG